MPRHRKRRCSVHCCCSGSLYVLSEQSLTEGTIVLGAIALVLVIRRVRQRRRTQAALEGMTPMSSPLLPVGFHFMRQRSNDPATMPLQPEEAPPPSPMPSSESFHFPVLSADGHLLPPPSPSATVGRSSRYSVDTRPLPDAPLQFRTAGQSPRMDEPRRGAGQSPVIGLFPSEAALPPMRDVRRSRGTEYAAVPIVANSPQLEQSWGLYQPQSATYHRSFSAEGEDMNFRD